MGVTTETRDDPLRPVDAATESVVRLREVSKAYRLYDSPADRLKEALDPLRRIRHRNFHALDNISIDVSPREIVGIVGKNGSGKSTLLKIIAGVLEASSGDVDVTLPVTPLLELGAGLNPELTGAQNIELFGGLLGVSKQVLGEISQNIIDFADIGEHINQPLKTYSSGMKSRLGFAIAVHVEPKILIVDEVLSVGDIAFQRKCYRKMEELFGRGSTVFYVSHNMQSVIQLCNRALLIHNGQLLEDGKPDDVVKSYQKLLFETSPQRRKALAEGEKSQAAEALGERKHPEHYSPGLISAPNPTNSKLIEFANIRVIDNDGLAVNQLTQGDTFDLLFDARFHQSVADISFGAQLQTLQGLILSGANMLANQGMLYEGAEEGETIEVRWSFRCLLVPGNYVIKVFAAPEDGTPAAFMEDALLFQVRPQQRANGGFVYLDQHIYAKRIETVQTAELD